MRLKEIDIIRLLVTIALVLFHSFAPIAGGWTNPFPEEDLFLPYFWLGKFSYSGMIETFVFISGFCYAFSVSNKGVPSIKDVVLSKTKRLLFPSFLWGVILTLGIGFRWNGVSCIVNGVGHLWFLPMLFWLFVIERALVYRVTFKTLWILLLFAIIPYPTLPMHLNNSFYYIVFFHLGVLFFKERDIFFDSWCRYKAILLVVLYVVLFIISTYFVNKYIDLEAAPSRLVKACLISIKLFVRLFCSVPVLLIYFIIGLLLRKISGRKYEIVRAIAANSMGIYILQEIILRLLYYKTPLCVQVGPFLYPLLGFVCTLIVSFAISLFVGKNKYLKQILGF